MFNIKSYGKRLDGRQGITGEIGGLTLEDIQAQIKNCRVGATHTVFHDGKHIGSFGRIFGEAPLGKVEVSPQLLAVLS